MDNHVWKSTWKILDPILYITFLVLFIVNSFHNDVEGMVSSGVMAIILKLSMLGDQIAEAKK